MSRRRLISSGSPFEAVAGYSRAVVDGDDVFVSGTTGYDYEAMDMPEGVEAQTHACFRNIADALAEAGSSLGDVVRVRYIITDVAYADAVFPIFGTYFREVRPAATLIVAGLLRPEMKIEIEVTARRSR
ncbi:RidA family protein [Ancylobacter sp. 6x-1]|uniref:RidA family protein n=1 Tax=Ancylobacter crimeensis TaxID=2579147 RepID=A0ABT0DF96_9HYPH|nr:RidA family protein [Ancylobacter crimeensis]MCK0198437.1 RidA family protein [Ancylobacter crimeensis]